MSIINIVKTKIDYDYDNDYINGLLEVTNSSDRTLESILSMLPISKLFSSSISCKKTIVK